jgi:Spy/CpxP family protein refolding chaperone
MSSRTVWLLAVSYLWLGGQVALAQEEDAVTGASPVWPTDGSGMHDFAAGAHGDRFAQWTEELGLSIEQQAVMADIVRDYAPRLGEQVKQGIEASWSVMEVAEDYPEYTTDTEAASQAAAEAAGEFVRIASEMRSAIYSVMTREQISKLESLIQERREHWEQKSTAADKEDSASASE